MYIISIIFKMGINDYSNIIHNGPKQKLTVDSLTYIYMCVCVCVCVYKPIYVILYIHIYAYTYEYVQCKRPGLDPWVRKIPWRRKWQPTPVFLPGESHGRRSLVGYSP